MKSTIGDFILYFSVLMFCAGLLLLVVGSIFNLAVGAIAGFCFAAFFPVLTLSIFFE